MQKNPSITLIVLFSLALLGVGVPYWEIPYAKVALPNSLFGYGLLIMLLSAVWLRGVAHAPFLRTWIIIGLAAPAAVMLRVVLESSRDPTSHNLWPIELILAGAVGCAVALVGALLGSGWLGVARRRSS